MSDTPSRDNPQVAEALRQLAEALAAARTQMDEAAVRMADAEVQLARAAMSQVAADEQSVEAGRLSGVAIRDSNEYQRALTHYLRLMRHRIANPLHIIQGMAQTLLDRPDLDEEVRRQMIEAIKVQAHLLELTTLFDPDVHSREESPLDPRPNVERRG